MVFINLLCIYPKNIVNQKLNNGRKYFHLIRNNVYIYIYIKSCILDSNTDSNLRQIVFVNIDTYVYNVKCVRIQN